MMDFSQKLTSPRAAKKFIFDLCKNDLAFHFDDDVKDTRQDIAPSETAQDTTVNDPGGIAQDEKISRETLFS